MFGIGETELVIIVVFAFLLFGPDKLPGMGRTLGRVLRQFREASDGFTEVVQTNIMDPASEELEKSPKQRKREASQETDGVSADAATDADLPAPKRETFAERKARLMAERKAAEEAAEPTASESQADSSAANAKDTNDAEESASISAADLYALGGQKSSRTLAQEAESKAKPEEDASDADNDAARKEDADASQ